MKNTQEFICLASWTVFFLFISMAQLGYWPIDNQISRHLGWRRVANKMMLAELEDVVGICVGYMLKQIQREIRITNTSISVHSRRYTAGESPIRLSIFIFLSLSCAYFAFWMNYSAKLASRCPCNKIQSTEWSGLAVVMWISPSWSSACSRFCN